MCIVLTKRQVYFTYNRQQSLGTGDIFQISANLNCFTFLVTAHFESVDFVKFSTGG